ncbi:hypothetical protein PHMEG_00032388 [Phytophthora megakarya]|uniref:Uncharacterized protein n=1 Tax=Phytophthora megakarya TaxID=4795 RepID=A0A225UUU5_9STRA|nr:hypothetical protein PHMEG_00032388 [Phytophthora megakarya]
METCERGLKESTLGGITVKTEEEEYDKELEDRLYPLDEVELQRRRVKNAETQRESSLEEISLNDQSVSSGGRDSSAFRLIWKKLNELIATSAKRLVLRPFMWWRLPMPPTEQKTAAPRHGRVKHLPLFANSVVSESTVLRNIGVSFELKEKVAMISEEIKEIDYFGKMRKDLVRTPLPLSEDVPGSRLGMAQVAKLRGDYWERLVCWVEDYYPKNVAEAIADIGFRANCNEDVSHYVNVVSVPTMETVLQPKI